MRITPFLIAYLLLRLLLDLSWSLYLSLALPRGGGERLLFLLRRLSLSLLLLRLRSLTPLRIKWVV